MDHTITVYGTDTLGCESELNAITIRTNTCYRLYVPNSFTPNNDGFNDVFKIAGMSVYEPNMKIFNRDGMMVYNIKSLSQTWNGDDGSGYYCQTGVYNWIMTYKDDRNIGHVEKGQVILIR